MKFKRKKGRRTSVKDAYHCKKLNLRIVQKIRYCGEDAPDLCEGCKFRDPFISSIDAESDVPK
jgi:hypothetical protein